ncbi:MULTISPECIES: LysR family transcriptional regulator [unclassified Pseudomonas]|uniref:LysR family transcriptional regulator n=1 Tax=unclassified Pseudomonas TaxID=196821 RepID=UPI0025F3B65F|nr:MULTISPECIES: LysR family transcriptional regulator [unclassified Pseudomonas]
MPSFRDVTIRQLRYFAAAADSGQFSLAAANEHISQSAITSAVSQLEATLGVTLFERLPHGVRLTREGYRFLERARSILNAVQDAVSEPLTNDIALSGTVRIGASYTVLGYYLPALLARFRKSYPNIIFDLRDLDRVAIEEAVADGELDLGLIILSNSDADLTLQKAVLLRSPRQIWLAADHPLMQQSQIQLKDIERFPYILLTVDEGEASSSRYWKSAGVVPDIAFRTGSMESLRELVAHRFGITILSEMVFRPWSLEGKRLEMRPLLDPPPEMELGLVWKTDGLGVPAVGAVHSFLIHPGKS